MWPVPSAYPEETPLPWVDVDEIRQREARWGQRASRSYALVVIGYVAFCESERARLAAEHGLDRVMLPDPPGRFLGFDVNDGAISGLCNCGYDESEANELRPIWAPRLNEHGLLGSLQHAEEFRALTNLRVSEHAPFVVSGLWIVDEPT